MYSGTAKGVYHAECKKEHPWVGNKRRIDVFNCWRQYALEYKDVPVDASKRIDDAAMDSIEPFNLEDMQPFNPAYLAGYLAERWDEDATTCYQRVEPRVMQSGKDFSHSELKKEYNYVFERDGCECQVNNTESKYVMMPTWLLYTEYEGKDYLFAMNGQTGKFIGNLPIDKLKFCLYTAISLVSGALGGFLLFGFC